MKYLVGIFLAALMATELLGCSSGRGVITSETPVDGFSLAAIGENPLPEIGVEPNPNEVRIALSGKGSAFARISFDADRLRYMEVENVSGGWAEGEAIVAAFRAGRGMVDFGAVPVRGAANPDASGSAVLLFGYGRDSEMERSASIAPTSAPSSVSNFKLTDDGAGGAILTWSYRNQGDYDQNGEVGIPDITPIALNYLHVITDPEDPASPIDGDGDGEIGIPDITPIALNYLRSLTDYDVQFSFDGSEETFEQVAQLPLGDGMLPEGGGFLKFKYTLIPAIDGFYRVVPFDSADSTFGVPGNTVEWRGGSVVSITISLLTGGVAGTGTDSDPYVLDQASPYAFEAIQGEEVVTDAVEWMSNPEFAVLWSNTTPGETESIIEIAGDFEVFCTLGGETSNIIHCRKPIGVS